MAGEIVSINVSSKRGEKKAPVGRAEIVPGEGIAGDAHAGFHPVRQISMLAIESHEKIREKGVEVSPGDFAENITTREIDLTALRPGSDGSNAAWEEMPQPLPHLRGSRRLRDAPRGNFC